MDQSNETSINEPWADALTINYPYAYLRVTPNGYNSFAVYNITDPNNIFLSKYFSPFPWFNTWIPGQWSSNYGDYTILPNFVGPGTAVAIWPKDMSAETIQPIFHQGHTKLSQ